MLRHGSLCPRTSLTNWYLLVNILISKDLQPVTAALLDAKAMAARKDSRVSQGWRFLLVRRCGFRENVSLANKHSYHGIKSLESTIQVVE